MEAARYFRVVSIFISYVTKLNDDKVAINSDLIEIIETTPDTVITLNTGRKLIVKESRQELRNLVNFHS